MNSSICYMCTAPILLGATGITTVLGDMCDDCAGVIRNFAGQIVEMNTFIESNLSIDEKDVRLAVQG